MQFVFLGHMRDLSDVHAVLHECFCNYIYLSFLATNINVGDKKNEPKNLNTEEEMTMMSLVPGIPLSNLEKKTNPPVTLAQVAQLLNLVKRSKSMGDTPQACIKSLPVYVSHVHL